MPFRDGILPHSCAHHVQAQPEWQYIWTRHVEARNFTLALIQTRLLMIVLSNVAAAERRCLDTALACVYVSLVSLPEEKTAALYRNDLPLLGSPCIVPIHSFPVSNAGVFRIESYFTLCLPGISYQCLKGTCAKKI